MQQNNVEKFQEFLSTFSKTSEVVTVEQSREEVILNGRQDLYKSANLISEKILEQTEKEQTHNHKHRTAVLSIITAIIGVSFMMLIIFVYTNVRVEGILGVFTLILGEIFALYKIITGFYFTNYLTENYEFLQKLINSIGAIQDKFDKK